MPAYQTFELKDGSIVKEARPSAQFNLEAIYPQRQIILQDGQGEASLAVALDDSVFVLILDERCSGGDLTLFGFAATPTAQQVLIEIVAALRERWRFGNSNFGGGNASGSPLCARIRRHKDNRATLN
jgi:hypothetical protein